MTPPFTIPNRPQNTNLPSAPPPPDDDDRARRLWREANDLSSVYSTAALDSNKWRTVLTEVHGRLSGGGNGGESSGEIAAHQIITERIILRWTFIEIKSVTERIVTESRWTIAILVELTNKRLPFRASDDFGPFAKPLPASEPPLVVVIGCPNSLPPWLGGIGSQARDPEAAAAVGEDSFVKIVAVEAIFVGRMVGRLRIRHKKIERKRGMLICRNWFAEFFFCKSMNTDSLFLSSV